MLDFLEIALVAYLVGASVEGVNTFMQLHHSLSELVKGEAGEAPKADELPEKSRLALGIILAVSIAGAFSWPCRLIHRSMKAHQDSLHS